MVVSLGGVAMIAQPSFLFGGKGINKVGLGLAIMQVSLSSSPFLPLVPILFFFSFSQFGYSSGLSFPGGTARGAAGVC